MDTLLSRVIPIRVRTSPACAAPGVPRRMNQTVPCFNRIAMQQAQQAPSRPGAFFEYSSKAMQYNVNPPSTERARESKREREGERERGREGENGKKCHKSHVGFADDS